VRIPIYALLLLLELLPSDMQAPMFSDVFAQIESRANPSHSRTGFSDPSTRVTAISTLDKGIDAARQFLCSLLTRRNTLVPISVLPPEILSLVFHFLVLDEPPLSRKPWIRVTHVCRRWRQVAIDDSSLWARIWGIPTNTKWISEILARAKNVPLEIELNDVGRSSPETFLMIVPHLSHTRHLRLHYLSVYHRGGIQDIFSREAPALEHLELTGNRTIYSPVTFPDIGGNMLFKGHAPRLRTFSLSRVVIPWSLVPRGQLTQLKIAGPDEDVASPGDLNELIDLLVNCPELEILALESCLPSQPTEFLHGRTIHLPHLSHLRLCGSTSRIMNMLTMLQLPSSTTLHLDCISGTTPNDSECLLLPIISAQLQGPAPVEFKSLTVTIQRQMPSSFLNITASTFPSTLRNRQSQIFEGDMVGNPELVLSFDKLSSPDHATNLLKHACKMLPISNLEFISMSATNNADMNWVELFGCCTNVTTMQAIGNGTGSLVEALTAPTATNAGSSRDGWEWKYDDRESTAVQLASTVAHAHTGIFPNLKFLGLTDLNFFEGIPFDIFERGLQQRMEVSGAPLKFLRMIDCDIITANANDLRRLVQDFDWDETEGSIEKFESLEAYERHLYNGDAPDADDLIDCFFRPRYRATRLRDWYSDGSDDDYPW
jgi:hypothetical protein